MPPQQAADLAWDCGLVSAGAGGKNDGWASCDPVTLNAPGDERVFLVGDLLDRVSPLFGFYPKTGQIAAGLGRIAAVQIAARAAGIAAEKLLPDSTCYVINRPQPKEMTRLDTSFRWRGDGVIQQTVRQRIDPQAGEEDLAWARRQFTELLGAPA